MIFKTVLWRLCCCQCNLFHLVMMDNECLKQVWNFKNPTLEKRILIIFLHWKWIRYIFVLFVLKRYLELVVLLWNQLELLYSLCKEIGAGPLGPPFCKFFIIHPRKKNLNQNDVEFDLNIGHALVHFIFFWIINEKLYGGPTTSLMYPTKIHMHWYILNLKHFFTKSHDNYHREPLKTPQTIWNNRISHRFISLLSDVIPLTKALNHHCADDAWTSNACHGHNFHRRPEIFKHCSQYHTNF